MNSEASTTLLVLRSEEQEHVEGITVGGHRRGRLDGPKRQGVGKEIKVGQRRARGLRFF